jgi:hypothetical protein
MNIRRVLCCALILAASLSFSQSPSQSPAPAQVPVMNGGAGPCSLDVTVLDLNAKPVYAASVKVHVAYGFGGFHKLDLEAGTNADGKVKFTGLPDRVRRPPLEFNATKNDLAGLATVDPSSECEAKRVITVSPHKSQDDH